MVSRIQGITVEIGGDTTKLSKALESVNKSIKGTQSGLKDVNKLLKLDPSNTELVVQKQKMLKDAIEAIKEKLTTLKTAAQQANEQLANGEITQQQYDALQREIVETEQNLRSLQDQAALPMRRLPRLMKSEKSSRTSDLLWIMWQEVPAGNCRCNGFWHCRSEDRSRFRFRNEQGLGYFRCDWG